VEALATVHAPEISIATTNTLSNRSVAISSWDPLQALRGDDLLLFELSTPPYIARSYRGAED